MERKERCWYSEVCEYQNCDNCIRFEEMEFLMQSSGIPEVLQKSPRLLASEEDYEAYCRLADIKDDIISYVSMGCNLYICSRQVGNGKTSWAIKLMLRYFDQIWAGNGFNVRGLFIHTPTLLLKAKDFNNPLDTSFKNNLLEADLVIWDDIASTNISAYDLSQLLMYIDHRTISKKSNIYTGNMASINTLKKEVGDRIASRIWNCSEIVEFKGKDRRSNGSITDNQQDISD